MIARSLARLGRFASRLRRDTSGLALIEFAYATPIMLTLGLYGLEAGRGEVEGGDVQPGSGEVESVAPLAGAELE